MMIAAASETAVKPYANIPWRGSLTKDNKQYGFGKIYLKQAFTGKVGGVKITH